MKTTGVVGKKLGSSASPPRSGLASVFIQGCVTYLKTSRSLYLSLCPGCLIELLEVVNGYVLQIELTASTGWVFVNLGIFVVSPVLYCRNAAECNENEDGSVSIIVYYVDDTE